MVLAGSQVTSGSGYSLSQLFWGSKFSYCFCLVFFFHKLLGCTARNYFSKYSQLWNQRLCTPTDQHWPDVKLGSCPFPQLVKELFFFFFFFNQKKVGFICSTFVWSNVRRIYSLF